MSLVAPLVKSLVSPVVVSLLGGEDISFSSEYNDELGVTYGAGTLVGIERGPNNTNFRIWKQVNGPWAVNCRYDYASTGRLSWRRTDLIKTHRVYTSDTLTTSGSWTELNSATVGAKASYVGGRALQSASNAAYVEVSVSGNGSEPYDVVVCFTGRTSGVYAVPYINGTQDDIILSDPDSLGYKAFSTYNASDLTRNEYVTIARDLTGTNTVRIVNNNDSPSPGGNNLLIEAVAITSKIGGTGTEPDAWAASTSYTRGDEVKANGYYYRCTTTGTSGATAPSHASGTASDGAVSWYASTFSTYWFRRHELDYASEREYALEVEISATTNDIGGQTHGNETVNSRTIKVDGSAWSETGSFGVMSVGQKVEIEEDITWTHANAADLASVSLSRTITANLFLDCEASITFNAACDAGWIYPGMMPGVSWGGLNQERIWDTVTVDDGTVYDLDDYASQNHPDVSAGDQYSAAFSGSIGGQSVAWAASVTRDSVSNYENSGAELELRPNVNNQAASGSTDWQMKAYFKRASSGAKESFSINDTAVFKSQHRIGIALDFS